MKRAVLVGPVAFTLIGGAAGICWAMLYRQEPEERAHVYLNDSSPCLLAGAAAGSLVGLLVLQACTRWSRLLPVITVVASVLMGVGIMAPIGWIAGDSRLKREPQAGMIIGAMIGAAVGLVVGSLQAFADHRGRRAEPFSRPTDSIVNAAPGADTSSD